ncbi:MAG TPA: cytochrome P450 [Pyrinomonadaceae bacterium]|nr:cytochrome P450 [Pyrinomonadaceae bacterium]
MRQPPEIDIAGPAFEADPYPTYAALREESPVCRVRLPDGRRAWLVTRYDDIARVLHDHARFSSRAMLSQVGEPPALSPRAREVMTLFSLIMSSKDPPDHTRLRTLVERGFAPRLIGGLRPYVEGLAGELLDAVEARARAGGSREFDLVADYAFPLPAAVIMKLLGVPAEDRDNIRRWSEPLLKFDRSAESAEALAPEVSVFVDYVRSLLAAKRESPGDDLISGLVAGRKPGEGLTEMELVSLTFQLIFAGHTTTSHLIGNGVLALLTRPEQMEKLKADPSLVRGAVDELLRFDAPQQMRARLAVEDAEVGGVQVRRGEVVLLALGSGNRDRAHFEAPDELDITRGDGRHLSFGLGIHRCFGVPLARLEGEAAIGTLLRRMPDLRLAVAPGELRRLPGGLHQRGLASLPVTF